MVAGTVAHGRIGSYPSLQGQAQGTLYLHAISAWELAVADRKKNQARRPALRGKTPRAWFQEALEVTGARMAELTPDIAFEAADVGSILDAYDPGDCILLASAHLLNLTLITRDARMLNFAADNPDYAAILRC